MASSRHENNCDHKVLMPQVLETLRHGGRRSQPAAIHDRVGCMKWWCGQAAAHPYLAIPCNLGKYREFLPRAVPSPANVGAYTNENIDFLAIYWFPAFQQEQGICVLYAGKLQRGAGITKAVS